MGELNLNSATGSDLANAMTNYSVPSETTDGASGNGETTWTNSNWNNQLGYFKNIPEINTVINAKAVWTIGKGTIADAMITTLLRGFTGWGKDTFNTILENMERTMQIGGDSYAEIIRDKKEMPINIKPLDPSTIEIVANAKGIITKYIQVSKINKKNRVVFEPMQMLHFCRNRIADEIHGVSLVDALKKIVLMRNEAMDDYTQLMHRHVKPLVKFILDTDDEAKIKAFKAKADAVIASGENLYLPKDTAEHEIISVAPNSTLNPLPWIKELNNYFYQAAGVPQIIVGGSQEFTEATAKIAYLVFQQTIEEEQLYIEEQIGQQLGIDIKLSFPASLENELLSDNKKDGAENVQPNETTAGSGQ